MKCVALTLAHQKYEVNFDAKSHKENTAFHYAARHGNKELVNILISRHADVNALDAKGNTPLHIALLKHHLAVASLLLNAGAQYNRDNTNHNSPLHFAAKISHQVCLINFSPANWLSHLHYLLSVKRVKSKQH